MRLPRSSVTSLALTLSTLTTVTAFNDSSNNNLAVYWGQGANQKSLGFFCRDDTIDIIQISFINAFPDQDPTTHFPGSSFGNACGGFLTVNKKTTKFLVSCPAVEADIKSCQSNGKKILLSLGGSSPDVYLATNASASSFADFLWGSFGPLKSSWTGPRPFGNARVDGFDFDIESNATNIPTAVNFGYATMVNRFRALFALEVGQTYYISAAPQCSIPDAHLADAISKSIFDFIFVQFYNSPECSARAGLDHTFGSYGGPPTDISFDSWISFVKNSSANPTAKIYLGLAAAPAATYGNMYLSPSEAQELITKFQCKYPTMFGGATLWDATFSKNNQINGQTYAEAIKQGLLTSNCSTKSSTSNSAGSWSLSGSKNPTFSASGRSGAGGSANQTGSVSGVLQSPQPVSGAADRSRFGFGVWVYGIVLVVASLLLAG